MNTSEYQLLCTQAGTVGMAGEGGVGTVAEGSECPLSSEEIKDRFFQGYQISFKAGDPVLTIDLPGQRKWKKRIWPRKSYPTKLFRWNTVEEILSYLISYEYHDSWISTGVPDQPPSGTILFFDRTKTKKYRNDGYDWKMRRSAKNSIREDRMKLKVGGFQLLYGCYTHSAPSPDFHRRSYWLIQNPNLIMVHYLEVESSTYYTPPSILEEDPTDLECYIVPANYNLLTISDCNLCALLNLVNSNEEAQALVKQLSVVLGQNLEKAQTLEEAIAMNNTGLPFDRFEESRSKKQRSKVVVSKKETPVVPDGDPDCVASCSGVNTDEDGAGSEGMGSSAGANRTGSLEVLKVLSASPHIIFCCPKDGPMSYVLLGSSTAKGRSATTIPNKRRTLDDEPTVLEAEKSDLAEASSSRGLEGVGGSAMKGKGREGGGVGSKAVLGMMRAASSNGQLQSLPGILTQALSLQNLIKPVDGELSSSLMDQRCSTYCNPSSSGDRAATGTSLLPDTSKSKPARGSAKNGTSKYETEVEDNDLQKFSKFASSLVGIDPLDPQGFSGRDFVSNYVDGVNDGGNTNRKGSLDMGMDLSAKEDMEDSWLLHSNTDHASGEEAVGSQSVPLTSSASENHCTYAHVHSSDVDWMDESGRHSIEEDPILSNLPSSNARPCVSTSTRTVLGCQTPVCNGGQNREADVCEDHPAHTPNASRQEGSTMQGMQSRSTGMESMRENGDDTLLGVSLDLDSDSLQHLLQLSFSPCKSATRDDFGQRSESDPAEDGETFFSLSGLIGKPTVNDLGSNITSGEVARIKDTQPPRDVTSYSLDPSSCNPTSVSHASTSFPPSIDPYPLSLSSPCSNVVTTAMDGANTSNDDVWNSWQHCNADSIRMWLKSMSETGVSEFSAAASSMAVPADPSLRSHPLPQALPTPPSIELPQDVEDLVLDSDLHQTDVTSEAVRNSVPIPSPSGAAEGFHSRPATEPGASMDNLLVDQDFECMMNLSRSSHTDDSITFTAEMELSDLLHPVDGSSEALWRDSNSSQCDPSLFSSFSGCSGHARSSSNASLEDSVTPLPPLQHHLSLPEINFAVRTTDQSVGFSTPIAHSPSMPQSLSPLQDIPEGVQMDLHTPMPTVLLHGRSLDLDQYNPYDYRNVSPIPSSPSVASTSSPSTVSMHEMLFDSKESLSVLELCEMLGETSNVQHRDFSHLTLTDSEQHQLLHAAQTIQNAFRKYKNRRLRAREKHAALMIENYYKRYKEHKQQRERAAKRIQQHYRIYKSRNKH